MLGEPFLVGAGGILAAAVGVVHQAGQRAPPLDCHVQGGHPDALGEKIDPGAIPDVPERAVAYVDGYGNLKTTLRAGVQPYAAPGQRPGDP